MKQPAHRTYRPSGADWLGEIPDSWDVKRLKYVASINDEALAETTHPEFELAYVDISSVEASAGIISVEEVLFEDAPSRARRVVRDGDTIVSTVRTYLRAIAPIRAPRHNLIVSTGFAVVRPRIVEPAFLSYALRESSFVESIVARSVGVSYPAVNASEIGTIPIPVPSRLEQRAIAGFLDRETAKLDTLVAKKRALIEKLQEKRTALISRTVTCGLPPDAARTAGLDPQPKLKPSGIDWLGDVPAHWRVTRLKYAAMKVVDCPHETPTYSADGDYLVIRTADLTSGVMDLAAAYRLDEEEFQKRIRREPLLPGDILYGREGERWGFAALVPANPKMCLGQRMMQFRAAHHFDSRFLMWQLNAGSTYQQGAVDTLGTTSPHVNVETIRNYRLSAPPSQEQRAIADYLDRETAKIARLAAKVEEAIERLQEYRSALITAAVTGKIDVRGAVHDREASVTGPDGVRVQA